MNGRFVLVAAVAAVWIFWGSTFAAMREAVTTIPPFVMGSVRFTVAGLVLWAILAALGRGRPTAAEWRDAAITGATLLLLGNGTTAWTVQFLPTGLNSLLLALSPVWMALFELAFGGARPTRAAIAGMMLGIFGLFVLLQPRASGAIPLVPALVAVGASIAWAFGSIYQRRVARGDLVRLAAMQMVAGGAMLALEALVMGQWQHVRLDHIAAASFGGLAWLIVFGSLGAYSAFLYTMRNASIGLASTYAYVNPLIAVLLGALLFHERLTPLALVAAAVILGGVALMLIPARRVPATTAAAA